MLLRVLIVVVLVTQLGAIPPPQSTGIPSTEDPQTTTVNPSTTQPGFPTPTEDYVTSAQLDHNGEYFLFWKINATHIQFETHVKTRGYVGFGISHHGSMYPADVVIGWVKDGVVHFKDRHTIGFYEPIIDKSQDWYLLAGFENDFGTVLKFTRAIDTCDKKEDLVIEPGTTKVIYSYHPEDPIHETGLTYHGDGRRGSKSLLLLDTVVKQRSLPADSKHFDFTNKNFSVPAQQTFYHCTVHKFENLTQKHHMVMFEPIIQKGHEGIVHHMLVYICPVDLDPSLVGTDYQCYHTRNSQLRSCTPVLLAWAVGGEPFHYPDDAGYPLGEPGDPVYLILETHYNNPTASPDFVDSSGLRMHYTPTLRKHDAAILMSGVMVESLQIVPPEYESFKSRGFCSKACVNHAFDLVQHKEIHVFADFLHTHLLGSGIKTRVVRNGTEIEPILVDNYYDFDYQEVRLLPKPRTLQPGDHIITECDYKSKGRRGLTYGGKSTIDEMCLSFLFYYPRIPIATCMSIPLYDMYTMGHDKHALHSYLQSMDWTNETVRQQFQTNVDTSTYSLACDHYDHKQPFFYRRGHTDPINVPYVKPKNTMCADSKN